MGQPRRVHKDIPQISTDRRASRKEHLQQLLKLTKEITSTFNNEHGGVCKKPLLGFPEPPRRPPYQRVMQNPNACPHPGAPRRQSAMSPHQQMLNKYQQQQMMASRGPALNPTNACYRMTDLCQKLESESGRRFMPSQEDCSCSGCQDTCTVTRPNVHKGKESCHQDYCTDPGFKPPQIDLAGNNWSGEVQTYCIHPAPCKADCFDHRPPGDYRDYLDF